MADKTLQHDLFLPPILLWRLSYHPLLSSWHTVASLLVLKAFVLAISPAWNVLPPDICLYFPNTKHCSTTIALKSYFQRPLYLIFQLTSSSSVWPLSISLCFNFFQHLITVQHRVFICLLHVFPNRISCSWGQNRNDYLLSSLCCLNN